MSISLSASSLLESALLEELQDATSTSTTSTATTAAATSTTSTDSTSTTDATSTTDSQSKLTKDLATLLKDLFAGNVTDSKTDLAQVQKDLSAESASTATTDSTDSSSTTSTLSKLLSSISDSLTSGDTSAALTDLASFLVQNGQTTGNLVNTTA